MPRFRPAELPSVAFLPETDLPDPLVTWNGGPVETATAWREERREELLRLFRHYVYGYAPEPPGIDATVECSETTLDGRATLTEVTIRFEGLPSDAPSIDLALFTPVGEDRVPVFLGLNREGNHSTVADDAVTITAAGREFGNEERGARASFWCVDELLSRGYGFATFHQADVDPDRDDFSDGVHPYFEDALPGPMGTEWGTLAAWAWGLQRAVDFLVSAEQVDEERISVIGHSRRGKAALLAGATDERIALVVPHQSGTGGVALSRENDQETVARINRVFPHWFNDVFPAFGGRESRLPVDQHLLVALVAPRPLLDTEGARDYWANPGRALDSLRAAAPVYDLLGAEGMVGSGVVHEGDSITPETAGSLLQYRGETGHLLNRDYWRAILDFADCHLTAE